MMYLILDILGLKGVWVSFVGIFLGFYFFWKLGEIFWLDIEIWKLLVYG